MIRSPLPRLALIAALMTVWVPLPVLGQEGVVVSGRVYDAGSNGGVQNALVTLEEHGAVLSSARGTFSFSGVRPGDYTLRVEAFGYLALSRSLGVVGDTLLVLPLEVDPVQLDPLTVELEKIDFDGRVRDPGRDSNVLDAQVLSDQGHEDWTNVHGRFDLDDVFEHVPLRLAIRAFGYLPVDTTFVPDHEERYPFDLVPDPLMEKMIEVQVGRLEARAGDRSYEYQPAINRDDMSRFTGNGTLQTVMESRYPRHILRRIGCFFVDERHIMDRQERTVLLQSIMANELQRVELLEFPGIGRLFMARVYTRAYFMRLIARNEPLPPPRMTGGFLTVCR